MALKLRPPSTVPNDIRDFTRWCREALVEGIISEDNIEDSAVTLPKLADIPTDTLLGRSTIGTGPVQSIACTAAGRALIDDAAASDQRTTLGLGSAATENTGTSGAVVPLLSAANVHASATCTALGIGSATPVGTQAAIADTSGATITVLEAHINQIKAVLRAFGAIAP